MKNINTVKRTSTPLIGAERTAPKAAPKAAPKTKAPKTAKTKAIKKAKTTPSIIDDKGVVMVNGYTEALKTAPKQSFDKTTIDSKEALVSLAANFGDIVGASQEGSYMLACLHQSNYIVVSKEGNCKRSTKKFMSTLLYNLIGKSAYNHWTRNSFINLDKGITRDGLNHLHMRLNGDTNNGRGKRVGNTSDGTQLVGMVEWLEAMSPSKNKTSTHRNCDMFIVDNLTLIKNR